MRSRTWKWVGLGAVAALAAGAAITAERRRRRWRAYDTDAIRAALHARYDALTRDVVSASAVIDATPEDVFAVLADPAQHAAIDGTGWVSEAVDREPLTAAGQVFRMSMYHVNHPDGNYQTVNRVQVFDPPRTISWETGYDAGGGALRFAGWSWRYDLTSSGASTAVTLSYDWSAVPDSVRERIGFPPFPPEHLRNSLAHLATLVAS